MTNLEIRELFNEAINLWGEDDQVNMVIEESAELIKAIRKLDRSMNKNDDKKIKKCVDNLLDEIVDVQITVDKLKYICLKNGVEEKVFEDIKIKKLNKLRERIEEEKIRRNI